MNPVYTIGHSTRPIEEFVALLKEAGVTLLIDVRRFPGSRRYPQYNLGSLQQALHAAGVDYLHEEVLGGRRRPLPDSPNTALRNAQFRGYADHMNTPEFRAAVARIVERAEREVQAVMCAEAVPWRCHRNLLADALLARGVEVRHIVQAGTASEHRLHKEAHIEADARVVYGPRVDQMGLL